MVYSMSKFDTIVRICEGCGRRPLLVIPVRCSRWHDIRKENADAMQKGRDGAVVSDRPAYRCGPTVLWQIWRKDMAVVDGQIRHYGKDM